ncbi:cupin domain-containing protein [Spirosoma taeanense]|uniref:Cupin domain-containing protein n=1 Tax=Spirosoma taeanense TaxID=2735870 RepID=A0A6M5YCG1_9BACT|nr:cupin domain-containing protein [Spirosoma taeanense]QJW91787.1 cupin domain-containing protein [Spirosoma taeanense]
MTAQDFIQSLHLQPHPEGGYFAETYRSAGTIPQEALPDRFSGARTFGTAIYFLLERHHISALHRIQADEIWHFYAGGPLNVFVINPDATLTVIRLGSNPGNEEVFQAVVPAGCWFGSKPATESESPGFSLVGCTVAPGFDFADFEMADRTALLTEFPQHRPVIEMLTAPGSM